MKGLILCAAALSCVVAASADAADRKSAAYEKGTTLTGCLQKGDEAGTFMLTNVSGGPASDNKSWELIGAPASLKMADHVGHKVSVTGTVVGTGQAAKMEGGTRTQRGSSAMMKEEARERHLKVTSFKHVAATCP
jgi:hypothetical protein